MSIPVTPRTQGGAVDVVFEISASQRMGFISDAPPYIEQVNNVAQRISTGGDAAYTSDGFDQLVIHGFETGQDRYLFESGDKRSYYSDGGVATHLERITTLASQWHESDAGVNASGREILDFSPTGGAWGPWVVVPTGDRLRAFNTNTLVWGDALPAAGLGASANVRQIFSTGAYLFVACDAVNFWRWTGQALATTWAQPYAGQARHFAMYKTVLYKATGATIVPATNNDGSTWGSAVTIGDSNSLINGLAVGNNFLLIAKSEGWFTYDGTSVGRLTDASDYSSILNYTGSKEWHGAVYTTELNRLQKVSILSASSRTQSDITPTIQGDAAKEQYGHGQLVRAFSGPSNLFFALDDGEGLYPEVLRYNDIGFHQVYRGASGDTMRAAGYSRIMGWLIINDGSTRYKNVINTGNGEYPDFATSGYVISPWFDAGYPDELKTVKSLTVETADCDANNTVTAYYRVDTDTAWTLIGVLTGNGKQELIMGGINAAVAAKKIQIKLVMARDATDITKTPRLIYPVILRVMVSGKGLDGFSLKLLLGDELYLRNGKGKMSDLYSMAEQRDFVNELRNAAGTVLFTDEYNRRYRVKVTSRGEMQSRPGNTEAETRSSLTIPLRMMSVYNGLTKQIEGRLRISATGTTTKFTWAGNSAYGVRRYGAFAYGA